MAQTARALCAHCHYRPVPPPRGGSQARYCTPECRERARSARHHAESARLLNHLRAMLGLPPGGGSASDAELRRIARAVAERLDLPAPRGRRGRPIEWGEHGTMRRYRQGCHCETCRAAMTIYYRERRHRPTEAA